MIPQRILIGEEIYLNIIECDKFKTNFISVNFLSPLEKSSAAENALLPFVLSRGCSRYPDMISMTGALDMLYGSHISSHVSRVGDTQYFGFSSYPLRSEYADGCDVLGGVIDIIGEMINSPYTENGLLSDSYVQSEKQIMIDRVRAKINDKGAYSLTRCREEMLKDECGYILETGSEEDICKISAPSLTKRLEKAKSELRIEIYCVGAFDKNAVKKQLSDIFSSFKRHSASPLTIKRGPAPKAPKSVIEHAEITQSKLCLGFRTGCYITDGDAPAYALFLEVLSSSPVSKLFMNVREKHSLCYYCSAVSDMHKGIMIVASGIDGKNRSRAKKAILEQIKQCADGEISSNELESAKKALLNSAESIYDDAGVIASWYFKRSVAGISVSPSDFASDAVKTGIEDIRRVASSIALDTEYFLTGGSKEEDK